MIYSIIGKTVSLGMKTIGAMMDYDDLITKNYIVILEANSMPSMGNPGIFNDFIESIKKNKV